MRFESRFQSRYGSRFTSRYGREAAVAYRHSSPGDELAYILQRSAQGGALFDPARDERFYQTTSGILLSGAADPVGLMLDDQFGGALGPELVDIDDLPTPSIIDFGGSAGAWDASTRTMSNTVTSTESSYPRFRFGFGLVAGRRYHVKGRLSGDLTALNNSGPIRLGTVGFGELVAYSSGTGIFEARQASASTLIEFVFNGTLTAPTALTIEELSIREILGAHASQSVTANRPTRVLNDGVWGLEFDGTSDRLEGDAAMLDIFRNAPGASIACVVEPLNLQNSRSILSWTTATGALRFGLLFDVNGKLAIAYRRLDADSAVALTNTSGGLVVGQKTILVVRFNYALGGADAATIREGGVQTGAHSVAGTGNTSDTSSTLTRVAANITDTAFSNMRLHGPILVAPRVWSDAQVQAIEQRLSTITGAPLS